MLHWYDHDCHDIMTPRFQSLKVTGLVAMLLATSAILSVAWWVSISKARGEVWQVAEDHARVLTSTLGLQLEALGIGASTEARREVLRQVRWDGQAVAAVLLDPTGRTILASKDASLEDSLYEKSPLAHLVPFPVVMNGRVSNQNEPIRHGQFVASIQPVLLTAQPDVATPADYGSILLIFDISASLHRARAALWILALVIFSFALLGILAGKHLLFDRLEKLNQAASAIAAGDFSTEIRFPGRDELATLSHSLNQAAAWVENSTRALRESEQSYRELVETSTDLIWSADAEGRWTFVNRNAALKIYGRKPEELIGKRISSFAAEDAEIENVCTFEQIDKGQNHLQVETVHLRKDDSEVHLSFNGFIQRDSQGRVTGLTGIARDTTARRQAEERVREQASLIDLAGDAIFVRDLEDRVLFWNRSCEQLFGWTKEEAVGQQLTRLAFRDLKAVGDAQQAVLKHGEWFGELHPVNKQGVEIILNSRWTLVRNTHGEPQSMLCVNTDITEKKLLEAQFLRVQRLEGIGTLASGIAHDLNNVFSPITISLALLKDKVADPGPAKMVNVLATSTKRGADIVKQLLTFARGTEGKMGLLQPLHIVKELINIINGTFPKAVQLKYNTPKSLWPVVGDATRLHQVLLNLCINARDAMPDGGVLAIQTANVDIDAHFARLQPDAKPGPHVVIEITDSGTGIPPENLQRIFDPFFTTKEPGKGTGLGLSSAVGIVRSHGGFITVKSTVGAGTTFKVHLPAQPSEGEAAVRPFETPVPRGNGELILVVEDEEVVRMATTATLERHGYRTILASNGIEAMSEFQARQKDIALILTDLMMPRQDGASFIRHLREINIHVPVIVSTGMDAERAVEKISQYGIAAILEKPYTGDQLIRTIHRTLSDAPAQN